MKKWLVSLMISMVISCNLYSHDEIDDVKLYINLNTCNQVDVTIYSVCWDDKINMPVAGWTIIDDDVIDYKNIKQRPHFYNSTNVPNVLKPTSISLPNHNGHTFANDGDNDYSEESLNATYNMLNITPMHETTNMGAWRKVENRGKKLAKESGDVLSITLVEYFNKPKYGLTYPKSFTRIYVTEDETECYKVDNLDRKSSDLKSYKINCKDLVRK